MADNEEDMGSNSEDSSLSQFPLRFSLFPNVPPYLRFLPPGTDYSPSFPPELKLTWAAPGGVSTVVLDFVKQAGWELVKGQVRRKEDQCTGSIWDCLPITEKAKDEIYFSGLGEEVKINQFPGLFVIGRKDCLWVSYEKMVHQFGEKHFGFLPRTFIVPQDKEELVQVMEEEKRMMIVKPPNWFCGIGIKLIDRIEDIPSKDHKMVVQEYIANPFLINGLKFDLRLYVLLTSIEPVKLYIYEDGLVRFATIPYSNDPAHIGNNMIHLTNYSINKNSEKFVTNEQPGEYSGHKWNLKTLWKYLEEELGLDWRPVWEATKDVCVKTVLCGQGQMKTVAEEQIHSDYNCYKLWGFDVFLDQDLKPWLLEVNNIPSLYVDHIDAYVNRPMVAEMFNIVGFHIPTAVAKKQQKMVKEKLNLKDFKRGNIGHDPRLYSKLRAEEDIIKEKKILGNTDNIDKILEELSPSDVRTIIRSEDELTQAKVWTRIFPTPSSKQYLQFLSPPCYSDQLLDAWEQKFGSCRSKGHITLTKLCEENHHLKLPEIS